MKFNNGTIRVAVREWIEDENNAKVKYGDINDWDTSQVTDMSELFSHAYEFNSPIGNWNVSNVKTMKQMFFEANSFNQPIENWDVSNVKDMSIMFDNASSFNHPLDRWNVSNVENMSEMFSASKDYVFNQPLNNWDLSNVCDLSHMFHGARLFNQPLDKWDVSKVRDMEGLFYKANSFNQPLNDWNVSSVKSMNSMFSMSCFNQPLDKWDVSNVEDMSYMFYFAVDFNQNISSWDVSKCKSFENMLADAVSFTFFEGWVNNEELQRDSLRNYLLKEARKLPYGDQIKYLLNSSTKEELSDLLVILEKSGDVGDVEKTGYGVDDFEDIEIETKTSKTKNTNEFNLKFNKEDFNNLDDLSFIIDSISERDPYLFNFIKKIISLIEEGTFKDKFQIKEYIKSEFSVQLLSNFGETNLRFNEGRDKVLEYSLVGRFLLLIDAYYMSNILEIYKEVNDKPKGFEELSLFYDVHLEIRDFLGGYKPKTKILGLNENTFFLVFFLVLILGVPFIFFDLRKALIIDVMILIFTFLIVLKERFS